MAGLHSMRLLLMLSVMMEGRLTQQDVLVPGDVLIAGLFPIHEAVVPDTDPNSFTPPQHPKCSRFYPTGLTHSLIMIHAVEVANRSPPLSNLNLTLGYHIYDTCFDATTALWAVRNITHQFSGCESSANSSQDVQPIMAVIGASSSEVSIAVARDLSLWLIPQISFASTAMILSDKSRFPAFMRTVPNDEHQTRAMVELLKHYDWTWVGIIVTDGDYGRSAMESFLKHTETKGICVAFKVILPDSLGERQKLTTCINNTVDIIEKNTKVKVVVSFAKPSHMRLLFTAVHMRNISNKVWVASESWSTAKHILKEVKLSDIGIVVGFTFRNGNVTPFHQYLHNLKFDSETDTSNTFLQEFFTKPKMENRTNAIQELIKNTFSDMILSIEMAVNAVANAVAELCKTRQCKNPAAFQPWELLGQLRNISFYKGGVAQKFDENGDINMGYDVCIWDEDETHGNNIIAGYNQSSNSFIYMMEHLSDIENVVSKCSESCQPGFYKKTAEGQHTCCYECLPCMENHYSNKTDADACSKCDIDMWSGVESSICQNKAIVYLEWNDGYAVALLALTALGVLLLVWVSALFFWHRNSPVVKAAGGPLCHLILFSLLGSFVSVIVFVGEPSNEKCMARQVIFGYSFTLCVSCILVKSLKILLAFQMNLELREILCKLFKPYVIISICMGLQVLICTIWLSLDKPFKAKDVQPEIILLECDQGSIAMFWVMLGYIALLALICFTFAYVGRKLPQKYNEAKFITFGMLIYLMAWVIFIPVHITTKGKYVPAVEAVVILLSNYGILGCHFFPKCYIILFKKEHNTKDAFLKNIYEYSRKSAENIRGLPGTETQNKKDNSVYIISNPSLVPEKEQVYVPKTNNGA